MPVFRQQRTFTNRPMGVQRFDTGGQEVAAAMSQLGETIGQIGLQEGLKAAKIRGEDKAMGVEPSKLTAFDPRTGKPVALETPLFMGFEERDAYRRVVQQRVYTALENEVKGKSKEYASKYENDPKQYSQMMQSFVGDLVGEAAAAYKSPIMEYGTRITADGAIVLTDQIKQRTKRIQGAEFGYTIEDNISNITGRFREEGFNQSILDDAKVAMEEDYATALDYERTGIREAGFAQKVKDSYRLSIGQVYMEERFATLPQESRSRIASALRDPAMRSQLNDNERSIFANIANAVKGDAKYPDQNLLNSLADGAATTANNMNVFDSIYDDANDAAYTSKIIGEANASAVTIGNQFRNAEGSISGAIDSLINNINSAYGSNINDQTGGKFTGNGTADVYRDKQILAATDALVSRGMRGLSQDDMLAFRAALINRDTTTLTGIQKESADGIIKLGNIVGYNETIQTKIKIATGEQIEIGSGPESDRIRDLNFTAREEISSITNSIIGAGTFAEAEALAKEFSDTYNLGTLKNQDTAAAVAASLETALASKTLQGLFVGPDGQSTNLTSENLSQIITALDQNQPLPESIAGIVNQANDIAGVDVTKQVLRSMQPAMRDIEASGAAFRKQQGLLREATTGQGGTDKHREAVDLAISTVSGVSDGSFFMSKDSLDFTNQASLMAAQSIQAGTVPKSLLSGFQSVASGSEMQPEQMQTLMQHFGRYAFAIGSDGKTRNLLAKDNGLSHEDNARLTALYYSSQSLGVNKLPDISAKFEEYESGVKRTELNRALGGGGIDFIYATDDLKDLQGNTQALQRYAPLVEYLYMSGVRGGDIASKVKEQYDATFQDGKGLVYDFSNADPSKTQSALSAVYGNEKAEKEFIRYIYNQLPSDYYLGSRKTTDSTGSWMVNTPSAAGMEGVTSSTISSFDNKTTKSKEAFLVPAEVSGTTGGTLFLAYSKDENGFPVQILKDIYAADGRVIGSMPLAFHSHEPYMVDYMARLNAEERQAAINEQDRKIQNQKIRKGLVEKSLNIFSAVPFSFSERN